MLEPKDLQAIAELIDARVTKTEETLNKKMDTLEEKLNDKINTVSDKVDALEEKITDVESTLINELVRTEDILTRRMEKIESNVEELNQYYRVEKLENENVGLTLQILEGYQKRLEALEKKSA